MIECREALLDSEIELVRQFLASQDLTLDKNLDTTLYLSENSKIIGTISKSKSVIKCVAVDDSYKGENLTGMLLNKIVEKMNLENIYSYQLFTKPKYEQLFKSLGFNLIAKGTDAIILEKGIYDIYSTIENMKKDIVNNLGPINPTSNIGAIVMNANPFTLGHQYLIEEASKRHDKVIVFLLSEDLSEFSFEERMSLAYLGTSRFENVYIVPSSIYMVSNLTFPQYFIKDESKKNMAAAELDAIIFKDYFMKFLYIKKRYVGSETKDYMVQYNNILKSILKDDLVEIKRIENNENVVSASLVRSLLKDNKIDEALKYLPHESHSIVRLLALKKYGKF